MREIDVLAQLQGIASTSYSGKQKVLKRFGGLGSKTFQKDERNYRVLVGSPLPRKSH